MSPPPPERGHRAANKIIRILDPLTFAERMTVMSMLQRAVISAANKQQQVILLGGAIGSAKALGADLELDAEAVDAEAARFIAIANQSRPGPKLS